MDPKNRREEKPRTRNIAGREVLLDPDGFLVNSDHWHEEIAVELAREQGLRELGPDHWRVIRFLREYYQTYGKAPLGRDIRKGIGISLMEIEKMFPGGIKYGARMLAGIPNPRGCI